jgi:polyphosphate glucokinase
LADALKARFGKPARILNDADVQGLGVVSGKGFECVLTLGTGIGSSFFYNGRLLPHLELGQHPVHRKLTYDRYIGDAVRRRKGRKKWNERLKKALVIVATLVNYDTLYLGGGNAQRIDFKLPPNVRRRSPLESRARRAVHAAGWTRRARCRAPNAATSCSRFRYESVTGGIVRSVSCR